jgi:hypothetical protein
MQCDAIDAVPRRTVRLCSTQTANTHLRRSLIRTYCSAMHTCTAITCVTTSLPKPILRSPNSRETFSKKDRRLRNEGHSGCFQTRVKLITQDVAPKLYLHRRSTFCAQITPTNTLYNAQNLPLYTRLVWWKCHYQ